MKYRAEVDGLRAAAILPVVFFHADLGLFKGGYVGVDIFFVISGFLITKILTDELDVGQFSIARFYERRARRILPALFFMIALCIPVAWVWLPPSEMTRFSDSLVSVALFFSNVLFWQQSGYFETAAELKPLLHTWSLAVEEQFYVLFPIFLALVYRVNRRLIIPVLLVVFTLSLGLAEFLVHPRPNAAFFLLPTRGWELLLGALCALPRTRTGSGAIPSDILSAVGLGMIGVALLFFDRSTPTPSLYTLLPTVGAALVLLHARANTMAGRILGNPLMVGIGLISYSTYLWHQPLLVFTRYAAAGPVGLPAIWLAVVAAFFFGYLSWRYVEAPFRSKDQVSLRSVAVLAIVGTLLIGAVGVAGHVTNGFRTLRSDNAVFARDAELQQVRTERQRLIRAGICHYDENLPIKQFIAHWDCKSDDEGLFDSQMAVFGDSHAADKVVALRLNGMDTWQITGAGCQVAPEFVKADRTHCHELFRLLETNKPSIKGVILANRFAVHELTADYLTAVLRYWGNAGVPVLMFVPMSDFELQQQEYMLKGTTATAPSFAREEKFFALLKNMTIPSNITLVKASSYWCAPKECVVARDGKYLMTDEDHLAGEGAKLFSQAFSADPLVKVFLGR